MPDYHILPDDRGWPMAHLVHADGSVEPRAAGSLFESSPVWMDVTVNNVLVPAAKVTVFWYHVEAEPEMLALDWEIESGASAIATLTEQDRALLVKIAGRPATAAWCGACRVRGRTPFPFTRTEWMAMGPTASL